MGAPILFASSFVLTGRGDDEPENAERTSGHLDGLFFIGVQRSDYNFNVEVSRGPFRISILRCPEVRLGFQL